MRHPFEHQSREGGCVDKLLQGLTALLGLALSGICFAQDSSQSETDSATWYQVEVIVFARPDGDASGEVWPKNLFLSYPFNWDLLRDPETAVLRQPEPSTELSLGATETDPLALQLAEQPQMSMPDLARDPMFKLPPGERQLNAHARALERRNGYQVLFHEAWRQPMTEDQELPALVITGGEKFGEHFELEGSIRLSLSRYLHLSTDLWLTRFEPNYGQELGTWPQLPERPTLFDLGAQTENLNAELPAFGEHQNEDTSGAWRRVLETDQNTAAGLEQSEELPNFLRQPYLPNRILTLKQSRRMRSSELHYLDHPLMGLLIIITPYQRPMAEQTPELELSR